MTEALKLVGGRLRLQGFDCVVNRGRVGLDLTVFIDSEKKHPFWGAADLGTLNESLPFPVDLSTYAGAGRWCLLKKGLPDWNEAKVAAELLCEWLAQATKTPGFYSVRPPPEHNDEVKR